MTALSDDDHVLEGGGKALRYVTLRSAADAKSAALESIVRQAFSLAGRRG